MSNYLPKQEYPNKILSLIENATVITPFKMLEGYTIAIAEGKIAELKEGLAKSSRPKYSPTRIDAGGNIVIPGMIDIHTHGLHGGSAFDSNINSIKTMATSFPFHGVTAFLPTTGAEPMEMLLQAARAVNELVVTGVPVGGAEVLGLNLEGTFISKEKRGAQLISFIRNPDFEEFKEIYTASKSNVKLVTIAPELDGSLEFIRKVKAIGITVSAGHSNATYEQMIAGIDAGITHASHTFNAMREFKHRDPGMLAAILTRDEVTAELIADNVHVHEGAMRLLIRAKGADRVALISDSMPLTGMPDGKYDLMGFKLELRNGALTLPGGLLAGSVTTLDKSLRIITKQLGVPLADAVKMSSTNPARAVKVGESKGSIEAEKDADLVILDKRDLTVLATIVKGRIAYTSDE